MTAKACLEDLIKYLAEHGYLYEPKKCELIATLHSNRNRKIVVAKKEKKIG